jgi:hypothetical protein
MLKFIELNLIVVQSFPVYLMSASVTEVALVFQLQAQQGLIR